MMKLGVFSRFRGKDGGAKCNVWGIPFDRLNWKGSWDSV